MMISRLRGVATALALLPVSGCSSDAPPRPDEMRGVTYPEPLQKPDFTLTTTTGVSFDFRKETEGFVTLLFFGYTYCPDVCPVHMANIAQVLKTLPPQISNRVKVVMVTVDPTRDTPERFGTWLHNFDPSFIGLIGSLEVVNKIQGSLQLPPASVYTDEQGNYTVGHSARVTAFTTDDRAHLGYPFGTRQSDWAHDIPLLVNASWAER
jgi:protein SCO1/2